MTDDGVRSNLAGADRFSVAVLPERSEAAIQLFAAHARDVITDSQVAMSFDPASGTVTQTFSVTTTTGEDPLAALYRHQWLNSDETFTGYAHESARGEMKLGIDAGFDVGTRLHRTDEHYSASDLCWPSLDPTLVSKRSDAIGRYQL
jgi:hypothetical protein